MGSVNQMSVSTETHIRKFTGTKGIHTLSIAASNSSDGEVVTLLRLEQNSTTPVSPFNETLQGLQIFAGNKSEPLDFAGTLGWGNGKVYMRASRETVQLIVFRQDEMVCAFLGAIGLSILISVPWLETCDFSFTRNGEGEVSRERYFCVPMSWMMPTNTGLATLLSIKYAWWRNGWLYLKVRASRTGHTTMTVTAREIDEKNGKEEVMRIQRFLFETGVDVELTEEEKEGCDDIVPPAYAVDTQQEAPEEEAPDKLRRRNKR